jgi:hypothetical protein
MDEGLCGVAGWQGGGGERLRGGGGRIVRAGVRGRGGREGAPVVAGGTCGAAGAGRGPGGTRPLAERRALRGAISQPSPGPGQGDNHPIYRLHRHQLLCNLFTLVLQLFEVRVEIRS